MPEYTAYNCEKKTKLPFFISTGTSHNNPKGRLIPFNGIITTATNCDTAPIAWSKRCIQSSENYQRFATRQQFNEGLKNILNSNKDDDEYIF